MKNSSIYAEKLGEKRPYRFVKNPAEAVEDVIHRLRNIQAIEGQDIAERTAAAALWTERLANFRNAHELTLAGGRQCIQRLLGRRCRLLTSRYGDCVCTPPADDHATLWSRDRQPCVWVSQPYHLTMEHLVAIGQFCATHELRADIGTWPSWYFPGHALTVLYSPVCKPFFLHK